MTASLRAVLLCSLASALCASTASSQALSIELNGSYVEVVHCEDASFASHELRAGHSTGAWHDAGDSSYGIQSADNRNLDFYFQRTSHASGWSIDLGQWQDANGPQPDFFLFEVGGDDVVMASAVFPGGSTGLRVQVTGWTATGHTLEHGGLAGQQVYGLCFGRDDLLDADGKPLGSEVVLSGVRLDSQSIDGAAFLVHDPDPSIGPGTSGSGDWHFHGGLNAYEPVELRFEGPWASATSDAPNPFLDVRLQMLFTAPDGRTFDVPGFFAGDGAGGLQGTIWKARFTPDEPGTWHVVVSHREGTDVALDPAPDAGAPGMLDGHQRPFFVTPPLPPTPGEPARLAPQRYVGKHYTRGADGRYFLKTGCNSPENFLAYRGFEQVADSGGIGILHHYAPHVADWRPGDPLFASRTYPEDSRGIIGAINYLSGAGVNSMFAMLLNLGGDGQDVHPFVGAERTRFDKTHYHVGRLDQWNTLFEHGAARGMAWHFGLAETERLNEKWLDFGDLGTERKLFLREMVARFAHLPSIKWNLCEEVDYYSNDKLTEFAAYIQSVDAYGHPVAFHNLTNEMDRFEAVVGQPEFSASSNQYQPHLAGQQVEYLRTISAVSGRPWLVQMDENAPWDIGLSPDNADELRRTVLYDVLFSGGHVEWYFGWFPGYPGGDLTVEDFRTREAMWTYARRAREFCEARLPFWRMRPQDHLLFGDSSDFGGGEVFVDGNELFAVYLPAATGAERIDLRGAIGTFRRRWFDPRTGLLYGVLGSLEAGAIQPLGEPPARNGEDWIVLLTRM